MASALTTARRAPPVLSQEPLYDGFEVGLLQGADTVAGDGAAGDGGEVKLVDELVDREAAGQVRLVAEHQERRVTDLRAVHEHVQLCLGLRQQLQVGNIDYEHDGANVAAVPLPHGAKPGLPAQVPALECDMAPLHLLHVEPDGGDGATGWSVSQLHFDSSREVGSGEGRNGAVGHSRRCHRGLVLTR